MKEEQKIIFLGLDNAGKTSLLTRFGGRIDLEELSRLTPTRGVDRQDYDSESYSMLIWDFGGQKDHRDEYLQDPEEYFLGTTLLIYVIDIQDPDRFEESVEYFKGILDVLENLEEDPDFLIFFHKFDPRIKDEETTFANIQKLNNLLLPILEDSNFNYESFLTSIYSGFPQQPKFTNFVKEMVEGKPLEQGTLEVKVERIGKTLESTLNAIVEISSNIMALDQKFSSLEQKLINKNIISKAILEHKEKAEKIQKEELKQETISQFKDVIIDKEDEK
jgi:GTPase SAR1 family protein